MSARLSSLAPLRPTPRRPPGPTETKEAGLPFAVLEGEAGVFEGYASLFGVVDLGRDMVMPGAFARSLAARGVGGVRMLWQHDPNEPVGAWSVIREDARGLFVRGRLNLAVRRARDIHALMRQGALDGLSIGFKTETALSDPRSGVRRLTRVDLWEISLVTFPLLPQARVATVKSLAPPGLAAAISRAAAALRP